MQRARVRPLEDGHSRVGAQPRMELAVADVDRHDARRACLEQAVGEAAGRGADVHGVLARDVDAECVESVPELLAAARHVRGRHVDRDVGGLVHLLPGLLVPGDAAGKDERLRLAPGLREPSLDEQRVEPLLHRHYSPARGY